ncbi:class I SAM-dependent methyltransferase [Cryobacterium sp. HLT2-28]|uniref:class I SAM-dependent methyltransferase n=1 Tax=Cryobacterium sp. HLT2-28 TaxID=1259146 RepID=UPI001F5481E6|nr:class I SAM-dependent methyltransferase [Cryobacterium sp. HLT2-28]
MIARGIDQVPEFIAHATNAFPTVDFAIEGLDSIDADTNSVGGVLSWYAHIHYEPGAIQVPLREFSRVIKPEAHCLLGSLRARRSRSSRTRPHRRSGGPWTRSARSWAAPASTLSNRMCGKLQASGLKRRSSLDARMLAKGSTCGRACSRPNSGPMVLGEP